MTSLNLVYVIVTHKPTGKAFTLNRQYTLKDSLLSGDQKLGFKELDSWDGWFPSIPSQSPDWAKEFPKSEFVAVWVEENNAFDSEGKKALAQALSKAVWENNRG